MSDDVRPYELVVATVKVTIEAPSKEEAESLLKGMHSARTEKWVRAYAMALAVGEASQMPAGWTPVLTMMDPRSLVAMVDEATEKGGDTVVVLVQGTVLTYFDVPGVDA